MAEGNQSVTSSISLPKSGGAIKGIGETFNPDLFTGTGNFSIPIYTTPCRGDFYPKLTLVYSSGNGNSAFGLGWDISIPRITRKTEKGLPTYTDKDVFVLSGSEDLVPYVDDNTNIDQESGMPIPEDRDQYKVLKYKPRTEGLFARIEKWENKNTNETHWHIITKENIHNIYGKTNNAKIIKPKKPEDIEEVYEWLLEETFDAKGNHILYEYIKEDCNLTLQGQHENNREYNNSYIRRIFYGNMPDNCNVSKTKIPERTATDHDDFQKNKSRYYMFEILFDYKDLPDKFENLYNFPLNIEEKIPETWTVRNDPFSTYRSGFEIRTLRLCRRVCMLHHIPENNLLDYPLVKSTDFEYKAGEYSGINILTSISLFGYKKINNKYNSSSMPPVTFKYSEFEPEKQHYQSITSENNELPYSSLNNPDFSLLDINFDGMVDIVSTNNKGISFWENRGNGNIRADYSKYSTEMPYKYRFSDSNVAIGDTGGDGLPDIIISDPDLPGFFEAKPDGKWKPFKKFKQFQTIDFSAPNTRLVDLTGDGLSDVLVTRDDYFVWYKSLGESGYDDPKFKMRKHNLDIFPDIYFNDQARVRLADMTGDGLNDIVFVHDGRIEYWPNLGYGNFGKRIVMENTPKIGWDFNPGRLIFADIDGTGCSDLIYVENDKIRFCFNQSGNGWSKEYIIHGTPPVHNMTSIQLADFFGTGTTSIIWSYDYNNQPGKNYKILDFCGKKKPHLLVEMSNNLGATTKVQYSSSIKYCLEDKKDNKPWITPLSFPVQVLDKSEVIDHISKTKLVTIYKYHHGYYDGREREFRGFGRVDRFDSEIFEDFLNKSLHDNEVFDNNKKEFHLPVIETRTWFHTGIYFDDDLSSQDAPFDYHKLIKDYEKEFYSKDNKAFDIAQKVEFNNCSIDSVHEAYRSLKGAVLQTEIYSQDKDGNTNPHPYQIIQNTYRVNQIQSKNVFNHAVFLTSKKDTITYNYEQNPDDPRIAHDISLVIDEFGNITDSATIVYPRRNPIYNEQDILNILYKKNDYINKSNQDYYYKGIPYQERVFDVTGIREEWDNKSIIDITHFQAIIDTFKNSELVLDKFKPYDWMRPNNHDKVEVRIVEWSRNYFRKNNEADKIDTIGNLSHRLDLGNIGKLGLPYESYTACFTSKMLTDTYGNKLNGIEIKEGGYHNGEPEIQDYWWITSGRQSFNENKFYISEKIQDPFGNKTSIEFDKYALLMKSSEDPMGNVVSAENDYRVLQSYKIKDPNDTISQVAFDTMGMVVGTSIMKRDNQGNFYGDSFEVFNPDFDEVIKEEHINNPLDNPEEILKDATTCIVYDLLRYMNHAKPVVVYTLSRETHESNEDGTLTKIKHSFLYSDGFGREAQSKIQVESKPGDAEPRWVGTGLKIYNNKEKTIQEYENFFSDSHEFGPEKHGVCVTLFYDPMERVICKFFPNHTYEKVIFDPWHQEIWDINDTVILNPRTDMDIKKYTEDFFRFFDNNFFQQNGFNPKTWYENRINSNDPAEKDSAIKAEEHKSTPTIIHFDTLGRNIITFRDNANNKKLVNKTHYDIEGNVISLIAPGDKELFNFKYDIAGRKIISDSKDAGISYNLPDITGKNPWLLWDANGNIIKNEYDGLRRQKKVWITDTYGARLVNLIEYGDEHGVPSAKKNNLRGKIYKSYDDSGELIFKYDFKSNVLEVKRKLLKDYRLKVDWNSNPKPELETDEYIIVNTYDALNRVIESINPDGSVQSYNFNEANLLESVSVKLHDEHNEREFVKNINYNSKGQRESIEYGNGVKTEYTYETETFRLLNIKSKKGTKAYQDLHYTYDPIGNITQIHDNAFKDVFNAQQRVSPINEYKYDAIYQLIEAKGREHENMSACHYQLHNKKNTEFITTSNQPVNNGKAIHNYTEYYKYDDRGNITEIKHLGKNNWTRIQNYHDNSNRIKTSKAGCSNEQNFQFDHDENGNIIKMPHLNKLVWDYANRLIEIETNIKTNVTNDYVYYNYDSSGQRIRKIIERGGVRSAERIYIGSYEIYREYTDNNITKVRETLHVGDDSGRIALVERERKDPLDITKGYNDRFRYQFNNHLGSSILELDENAKEISYEEFFPYGGTSNMAGENETEVKLKRYRYSGKERDDESGLYYYGARYYAPWLGRWLSCDPAGTADGLNLYVFVINNSINKVDSVGNQALECITDDSSVEQISPVQEKTLNEEVKDNISPPNLEEIFPELEPPDIPIKEGSALGSPQFETKENYPKLEAMPNKKISGSEIILDALILPGITERIIEQELDNLYCLYQQIMEGNNYEDDINPITLNIFSPRERQDRALIAFTDLALISISGLHSLNTNINIGNKLDYSFGKSTGDTHSRQQSQQMLNNLEKIGIHDTPAGRQYFENALTESFYTEGISQADGRVVKDFLLMGPNGGVKVQGIWEGTKLITIMIFGGP